MFPTSRLKFGPQDSMLCSPSQVWAFLMFPISRLKLWACSPPYVRAMFPISCLGACSLFPTSSSGCVPHLKFGACSHVPHLKFGPSSPPQVRGMFGVPHLKFRLTAVFPTALWCTVHVPHLKTQVRASSSDFRSMFPTSNLGLVPHLKFGASCSPPQALKFGPCSPPNTLSSGHVPHLNFGVRAMFPISISDCVPHHKFGAFSPPQVRGTGHAPQPPKFGACSPYPPHIKFDFGTGPCSVFPPQVWGVFSISSSGNVPHLKTSSWRCRLFPVY